MPSVNPKITIGGKPTYLPTQDMFAHAEAICVSRLNRLYFPHGCSRHADGLFLMAEADLDTIYAADTTTLVMADGFGGEDIQFKVWCLPPTPFFLSSGNPRLWAVRVVDERYWFQRQGWAGRAGHGGVSGEHDPPWLGDPPYPPMDIGGQVDGPSWKSVCDNMVTHLSGLTTPLTSPSQWTTTSLDSPTVFRGTASGLNMEAQLGMGAILDLAAISHQSTWEVVPSATGNTYKPVAWSTSWTAMNAWYSSITAVLGGSVPSTATPGSGTLPAIYGGHAQWARNSTVTGVSIHLPYKSEEGRMRPYEASVTQAFPHIASTVQGVGRWDMSSIAVQRTAATNTSGVGINAWRSQLVVGHPDGPDPTPGTYATDTPWTTYLGNANDASAAHFARRSALAAGLKVFGGWRTTTGTAAFALDIYYGLSKAREGPYPSMTLDLSMSDPRLGQSGRMDDLGQTLHNRGNCSTYRSVEGGWVVDVPVPSMRSFVARIAVATPIVEGLGATNQWDYDWEEVKTDTGASWTHTSPLRSSSPSTLPTARNLREDVNTATFAGPAFNFMEHTGTFVVHPVEINQLVVMWEIITRTGTIIYRFDCENTITCE